MCVLKVNWVKKSVLCKTVVVVVYPLLYCDVKIFIKFNDVHNVFVVLFDCHQQLFSFKHDEINMCWSRYVYVYTSIFDRRSSGLRRVSLICSSRDIKWKSTILWSFLTFVLFFRYFDLFWKDSMDWRCLTLSDSPRTSEWMSWMWMSVI